MTNRIDKLNPLIQQNLSQIIAQELEFPENSIVTITRTDISPDMKNAKIYISVLPDKFRGTNLEILRKNKAMLEKELKKKITIKFIPKLKFLIDENPIYASEIDKILDEL